MASVASEIRKNPLCGPLPGSGADPVPFGSIAPHQRKFGLTPSPGAIVSARRYQMPKTLGGSRFISPFEDMQDVRPSGPAQYREMAIGHQRCRACPAF